MAERAAEIEEFLDAAGWGDAVRAPLAGDASFRRYERLALGERHAVLMDAPPPHEDVRPFVAIDRHLRAMTYSAPEIYAQDAGLGVLLLEDLGDDLYTSVLDQGADEGALYRYAVDLLVDLQQREPPRDLAAYDTDEFLTEASLFVDWYLPAVSGQPVSAAARSTYLAAWEALLPVTDIGPPVLVLRDYHADNLVWLAERDGLARVGLLDFQDALAGPCMYDLVSLLEDARRDIPAALTQEMFGHFIAKTGLDPAAAGAAYAVLGAQRNSKIIGIFTRLWQRDGKEEYLAYIPRVWRLLEGDLRHPALAVMRDWFESHVPPPLRNSSIMTAVSST